MARYGCDCCVICVDAGLVQMYEELFTSDVDSLVSQFKFIGQANV